MVVGQGTKGEGMKKQCTDLREGGRVWGKGHPTSWGGEEIKKSRISPLGGAERRGSITLISHSPQTRYLV